MASERRLAMLAIGEKGFFGDAVLLVQGLAEQQVGGCRGTLTELMTVLHGLLTTLRRQLGQGLVEREVVEMVVEVKHKNVEC